MPVDRRIADLAELPRKNGELVFEAPWQSRAFGMAVALNERGTYEWDAFRGRLVDEIAHDAGRAYYASWLNALERLLLERGLLTADELRQRTAQYVSQERDEVF